MSAMHTHAAAGSPEMLVLGKYPNAYAYDDGRKIVIYLREFEEVTCTQCGRPHVREKLAELQQSLGSAGSSESAWRNAANKLGLL